MPTSPRRSSPPASCLNCKKLAESVATLTETVKALEAKIANLSTGESQTVDLTNITVDLANTTKRVKAVEELVEERTNRQLRKTLVFRGVPQAEDEKSYEDCEIVLAKTIASTLGVNQKTAQGMIDRCHRGGNPKHYVGKTRPIFAAMHQWKRCEEVIRKAREKKTVFVDYKYGPLTTRRRHLALKKRRELIDSGVLTKAHIAYPAKLVGKKDDSERYTVIEDFSHAHVEIK